MRVLCENRDQFKYLENNNNNNKKNKKPAKNFQQWPKTKRKAWNKFLP